MTTVFTVIRFTTQKKENTIDVLGTFLNVQSAYRLVEQIYQEKIRYARNEGEPLPDWMNNRQALFQHQSYYFSGVRPTPIYQLVFDDSDYGESVAIVQTMLQQ